MYEVSQINSEDDATQQENINFTAIAPDYNITYIIYIKIYYVLRNYYFRHTL